MLFCFTRNASALDAITEDRTKVAKTIFIIESAGILLLQMYSEVDSRCTHESLFSVVYSVIFDLCSV